MSRYNGQQLFIALKSIVKKRKITYKYIVEKVSFSESTLKNIFYTNNSSIERIIEICNAINIEFPDLVDLSRKEFDSEFSFSNSQEVFFAQNPHFYYFFREIFFEKKTLQQMEDEFCLTKKSIFKYLRKLEELDLLELHPNNRIKFQIYGKLEWIKDGPWIKNIIPKYSQKMVKLLLKNLNDPSYYSSLIGYFTLSPEHFKNFKNEVKDLEEKYKRIAFRDYLTDEQKDFIPVTWQFNILPVDVCRLEGEIKNI